jgi:hypothetical protein
MQRKRPLEFYSTEEPPYKKTKTPKVGSLASQGDVDILLNGDSQSIDCYSLLSQKLRTVFIRIGYFPFETTQFVKTTGKIKTVWKTYASYEPFSPRKNIFSVKILQYSQEFSNGIKFCVGATTDNRYRETLKGKAGVFIGGSGDIALSWGLTANSCVLVNGKYLTVSRTAVDVASVMTVVLDYESSTLKFSVNGDVRGEVAIPPQTTIYPAISAMGNLSVE